MRPPNTRARDLHPASPDRRNPGASVGSTPRQDQGCLCAVRNRSGSADHSCFRLRSGGTLARASFFLIFFLASCRSPRGGDSSDAADVPSLLRRMRAAHGGEAACRAFAAASFSFHVRVRQLAASFPEIAIRFDDFRRIWILGPGRRLELDLACPDEELISKLRERGALPTLEGTSARGPVALTPEEKDLAFALRAIRYFFSIPIASASGSWDFVGILPPRGVEIPPALELRSREPDAPFETAIVHVWPGRPLSQALYLRAGQGGRPRAFRVIFSEYEVVSGVSVARRRCHVPEIEGLQAASLDPFGRIAEQIAEGSGCDIEERIGDVKLMDPAEAELLWPPTMEPAPGDRGRN